MKEYAPLLVFVIVAPLISFAIPLVFAEVVKTRGPKALSISGWIALAAVAGLVYLAAPSFGYNALLSAGVGAFIAALAVSWNTSRVKKEVRERLDIAPDMVRYALTRFNYLNSDGDDLLSSEDLRKALETTNLIGADYVRHMLHNMSEIGHEADVLTSFAHPGAMAVVPIYKISRDDLTTYVQRLNDRYAAWLTA